MTIKKAFVEVVEFLEANQGVKVSKVLPQVIEMVSAKSGSGGSKASVFHKDENGEVVAVQCYYFKKWCKPSEVEFGKKAGSATGLNSMCKAGVSFWTKQQREMKAAQGELLDRVAAGELPADKIADEQVRIAEEAARIQDAPEGVGPFYDSLEDLLAAS